MLNYITNSLYRKSHIFKIIMRPAGYLKGVKDKVHYIGKKLFTKLQILQFIYFMVLYHALAMCLILDPKGF